MRLYALVEAGDPEAIDLFTVLDEPPDETLAILDVARFAENRPVPEPQLV